MKTLDYLHLDESAAGKLVRSLQQLLADFQVHYMNLRGFHWNIQGHGFFVLHSKFEEMYDDTAEKVDQIAERILMLGGVPSNKFSEYLKIAKVREIDGVSCGGGNVLSAAFFRALAEDFLVCATGRFSVPYLSAENIARALQQAAHRSVGGMGIRPYVE